MVITRERKPKLLTHRENYMEQPLVDMDIQGNTRRVMVSVPDEPVYDHTREVGMREYLKEIWEQETPESIIEIYGIHSWYDPRNEEEEGDITIEIEVQHLGKLLHDYALWVVHQVNYQLTNE